VCVYRADVALCLLAQFGQLLLHYALTNYAGLEMVEALLQAYPDSARKFNMVCCGADIGAYAWVQVCFISDGCVCMCVHVYT